VSYLFIIDTFFDANQLSWVQENLKSLPKWPTRSRKRSGTAAATLEMRKKESRKKVQIVKFTGRPSGFPVSP
jgi:hypothetical protein